MCVISDAIELLRRKYKVRTKEPNRREETADCVTTRDRKYCMTTTHYKFLSCIYY